MLDRVIRSRDAGRDPGEALRVAGWTRREFNAALRKTYGEGYARRNGLEEL